jgi:hypothetical protein
LVRAIFSVQVHVEEKLRFVRQHLVTVTSILALEQSSALDLHAVITLEAEHGVGLTTRPPLRISRNGAVVEAIPGDDFNMPVPVDRWEILAQLKPKAFRNQLVKR